MDELCAVAGFTASGAQQVVGIFEEAAPTDRRPRLAIEAAWAFANAERRTKRQRLTAFDAHRAAKGVAGAAKHAAHAAGDAAGSAYLHPFAKADQLGHILRADAHAACALELLADDPCVGLRHVSRAADRATPLVVEVLRRYPPATVGPSRVSILMKALDDALRAR